MNVYAALLLAATALGCAPHQRTDPRPLAPGTYEVSACRTSAECESESEFVVLTSRPIVRAAGVRDGEFSRFVESGIEVDRDSANACIITPGRTFIPLRLTTWSPLKGGGIDVLLYQSPHSSVALVIKDPASGHGLVQSSDAMMDPRNSEKPVYVKRIGNADPHNCLNLATRIAAPGSP